MAASGDSAALDFAAAAQATLPPGTAVELRQDLRLIAEMIEPGSRVLDIGCGDGALLAYLARQKSVDGRGIELSQSGVNACVGHGLSVIQGDADRDLEAYPAGAFGRPPTGHAGLSRNSSASGGGRSCRFQISGFGGFVSAFC
jgi:SAM-dependent methyltransferase